MNSYLFSEMFGTYVKALIFIFGIFIFATFFTFEKKIKISTKIKKQQSLAREENFFNEKENICEIAIDDLNDNWQYQKIDVDDLNSVELSDTEWEEIAATS